jgi:hypothetical protein
MTLNQATHFIKAPCNLIRNAPNIIKSSYDYVVDPNMFNFSKTDDNIINIPPGYSLLYTYILKYSKMNPTTKIITIGGDRSISASTISAMNEKYMVHVGDTCRSNLKVLYIGPYSDLDIFDQFQKSLSEMVISTLIGMNEPTFIKNKLLIDPDQLLYLGVNDTEVDDISSYGINCISHKKMNQIGVTNIVKTIISLFGSSSPIHISFDVRVLDNVKIQDMLEIFTQLKSYVVSIDIVEFNVESRKSKNNIFDIKKAIHETISILFDIKEKSINIFNEHSEFLIYRPLCQKSIVDYGWYIVRGMSIEDKNKILQHISIDNIVSINKYLVTKTSMDEQNNKSYGVNTNINDCVLFPDEKIAMCFELVNSNSLTTDNIQNITNSYSSDDDVDLDIDLDIGWIE